MSILIRGIDMPNERENFQITIKYNGIVLDTETEIQIAEAQEIFPHGDLIDKDALSNTVEQHYKHPKISRYDRDLLLHYLDVEMAPVIIPAEEVYGRYTDMAGNFHWCGTHSGEHKIKIEEGN